MNDSETALAASPMPWESPSSSLVLTKEGISGERITLALSLESRDTGHPGVGIAAGPTWWAFSYDEHFSTDVERQVQALSELFTPRSEKLRELVAEGHAARVDITGTVETGCKLRLSVTTLARLSALGIPVTFTTLAAPGVEEEDPLAWLD
ncbi:hypothetical protein ACFVZM_25805 [Streptomyces sioyaensis]|uniref:hypothetical protein n=1 Tax=Streptomyces sioyaensis TaxID=67364 RepID=UPI00369B5232